jgi:hypothetical protein
MGWMGRLKIMQQEQQKNRLIALGVGLFIIVVGLIIYRVLTFHLISSYPANNAINMPTYQAVSFNFSQKLSGGDQTNTITTDPAITGVTSINGKSLVYTPSNPLTAGTKYNVTLSNITNLKGQHLPTIKISFTAVYVPFSQLPSSVEKRYVSQQDGAYETTSPINKLNATLPHQTDQYDITYNGTYTVQINTASVSAAEAEAAAYIQSFGVDPTTLNIYYNVPAVYSGKPGP